MQAAQAGDRAALTGLYERYRPQVYHLCNTILRDHALAEDATHDTFERALGALDRFDVGRPIWPWLSTIARRLCIDTIRVRGRAIPVDDLNGDASRYADATSDAPLDDVLSAEERDVLVRALAGLPARQRRAVMLYALEGWQYADIASAEGISLVAVKSIIWRARTSLRRACRSGPLSVVVVPIVLGVRAARRASLRLRANLAGAAEAFAGAGLQGMQAAALGLVLLLGGGGVGAPAVDGEGAAAPGQGTLALADGSSNQEEGSSAGEQTHPSPVDELERVADEITDPTGDATPEDTQFTSFAVSPSYARDRTVFATGAVACYQPTACQVLFVSRDGGATWERLPGEEFFGTKILLPPTYPDDPRIFTIGFAGLQVSRDGGASFDVLVPTPTSEDAAISPMFAEGDPRILIGWHAVLEYQADSGAFDPIVTGPTGMAAPTSVAFSPGSVSEFIVGEARADEDGQVWSSFISRCNAAGCAEHQLAGAVGVPSFRSGGDTVYAFTTGSLFAVDAAGERVEERTIPKWGVDGFLSDLLVLPGAGDLIAAVQFSDGPPGGLSRSTDGGRTWTRLEVDIPAFEQGAVSLAVTLTGRVLASATAGGLACSDDVGLTWTTRCSAEA